MNKMSILVLVGLVGLAGCGSGVMVEPTASKFCADQGFSSDTTSTLRTLIEIDRDNGWTKNQELSFAADICAEADSPPSCVMCVVALIDEIYPS